MVYLNLRFTRYKYSFNKTSAFYKQLEGIRFSYICPVPNVTLESNTELVNIESALSVGDVLQYRCKSAYSHVQGDLFRACQRTGVFTGDPPWCQGNNCLFSSPEPNATFVRPTRIILAWFII